MAGGSFGALLAEVPSVAFNFYLLVIVRSFHLSLVREGPGSCAFNAHQARLRQQLRPLTNPKTHTRPRAPRP